MRLDFVPSGRQNGYNLSTCREGRNEQPLASELRNISGHVSSNEELIMIAKKILFPTDFSSSSDEGLKWAESLARDTGATLLIVHVEEPPAAYGGGEMYYGIPEPDKAALQAMLGAVKPADSTVPHEHRLVTGDPAEAIVHVADSEHCDLIVLGTHGRTGFRRLLMGSVAEAVVRRANVPVLTVKHHQETAVSASQPA
jgi:nucleotide-binding universal stress UspA family protein